MRNGKIKSLTPIMDFENSIRDEVRGAKQAVNLAIAGASVGLMAPASVMAAGELEKKVGDALDKIIGAILGIAVPIYILTALICLIMIVASSGRKAEMAKDWLIRATIGIVAIGSLAAIQSFIQDFGTWTWK